VHPVVLISMMICCMVLGLMDWVELFGVQKSKFKKATATAPDVKKNKTTCTT
jgi:hypothetical protein